MLDFFNKIRIFLYPALFLDRIGKSKNYYLYHDPQTLFLFKKNYKLVETIYKVDGKVSYSLIRKLFKSC